MADAANAAGADRTYPMYVGGRWVETDDRRPVVSPADGSVLGSVCAGDRATVEEAVRAARQASSVLAGMSAFERADLCYAIAAEIDRDAEVLAPLLSMEQGKPLHSEARGEVARAATVFRDAAEQAKWSPAGTILATRDPRKRVLVERRPRGVYGTITPWNSPLGLACGYYMAPAIATGNAIVWLPALSTSAISSRLCECLDRAGLPVGTVNLVIGDGPVVGDAIVTILAWTPSDSPAGAGPGASWPSMPGSSRGSWNWAATAPPSCSRTRTWSWRPRAWRGERSPTQARFARPPSG